jgi:hypothetical protein
MSAVQSTRRRRRTGATGTAGSSPTAIPARAVTRTLVVDVRWSQPPIGPDTGEGDLVAEASGRGSEDGHEAFEADLVAAGLGLSGHQRYFLS